MRMAMTAILLGACLTACRFTDVRPDRSGGGEAQIVALSVRTHPPGATVRVNALERTWTTPCDVADFSLQRGSLDVEVSLEGYETVQTRVAYDGSDPAWLKLKLTPKSARVAPLTVREAPKPAPVEAKPVVIEPQAAKPAEEPKPAPVRLEPAAGGIWVKVVSSSAKTVIKAKSLVTEADRPGEYFLPDFANQRVTIEFLDPKTDLLLQSVEFAPGAAPAAALKPPAPKDPAVTPEVDRVGEIKVVSKTYGVFVKLDPGLSLEPGEEILIFRDGREVARTKILKITKADDKYPDGAAQVQKEGAIQKGDEVRRTKP